MPEQTLEQRVAQLEKEIAELKVQISERPEFGDIRFLLCKMQGAMSPGKSLYSIREKLILQIPVD